MKKFIYILRKILFIPVSLIFIALLFILRINNIITESNTLTFALIFTIVVYITLLIRPKKTEYAKNGEKWIKKYTFKETTEETKTNKKDSSTITYYTHHFIVSCISADGSLNYNYEITKNGGYSGKDKDGKQYSKRIAAKLYTKDLSKLEN
ncbi:MAG: hypothetical protein K6G28_02175 [Acholeplasmatales bacterium]|nr:hypothetical protein [Acholeplasmatales bacterium]